MAEEGVEHPHPVEALLHQLLELLPDDLQLLLLAGGAPRPTVPPLWPPTGERWEWCLHRVPDVEPLPMPPLVGVAGEVCGIRVSHAQFSLQGETPHRRDLGRVPHRQGSRGEELPEEIHVWLHPKESLANGDETGDVQHPHRIKML